MRARIVLKGADGVSATATALGMKVCLQTVGNGAGVMPSAE